MQRQPRLGDILDDYCPRERRVTNHAVVAMLGDEVKQTRCTTCDAEHAYKQAKVPRQRRKSETPAALYAAVLTNGPKRVTHHDPVKDAAEGDRGNGPLLHPADVTEEEHGEEHADDISADEAMPTNEEDTPERDDDEERDDAERDEEEGPVHRPLIRASLPRTENTPPPQRQGPDFTIRQPGGRPPNRFRPRNPRGGQPFQTQGNRGNGNAGGPMRGGMMRQGGGRPAGNGPARHDRRDPRKRSK